MRTKAGALATVAMLSRKLAAPAVADPASAETITSVIPLTSLSGAAPFVETHAGTYTSSSGDSGTAPQIAFGGELADPELMASQTESLSEAAGSAAETAAAGVEPKYAGGRTGSDEAPRPGAGKTARVLGIGYLLAVVGAAVFASGASASAQRRAVCPGLARAVTTRSHGLRLVSYRQLDSRLAQLVFSTSAVSGRTAVRVLTPARFDCSGGKRYPMLLLLHGSGGDDTSWTTKGQAEQISAHYPIIVVMPSTGTPGYVNYFNNGHYGQPAWETYHIGQLIPWLDHFYPTVGERSGRAIAGFSMGGNGAMLYAARHPDLFVDAASFSGNLNLLDPILIAINQASPQGVAAFATYATNGVYWHGENPVDLADNLRALRLQLFVGNGNPGPLDPRNPSPSLQAGERVTNTENITFHDELLKLGIPSYWDAYGAGTHSWPYWARDLTQTLPMLMRTFDRPPTAPKQITYRTIDRTYQEFGWTVHISRRAWEFSELRNASRRGFQLIGSGSGTVTTPGLFSARATLRVRLASPQGARSYTVHADDHGAIRVNVGLGRPNSGQEYRPGVTTIAFITKVTFKLI